MDIVKLFLLNLVFFSFISLVLERASALKEDTYHGRILWENNGNAKNIFRVWMEQTRIFYLLFLIAKEIQQKSEMLVWAPYQNMDF